MPDLGELHVATTLQSKDGSATLVLKGTSGVAEITVPESAVTPLRETVEELELVYDGPDSDDDSLIGWSA